MRLAHAKHNRITPARATRAVLLLTALSSLVLTSCANFDPRGPQSVEAAARSALRGSGNISIERQAGGIVVVRGWVEDGVSENAVLNTVENHPDVTNVVDYLVVRMRR